MQLSGGFIRLTYKEAHTGRKTMLKNNPFQPIEDIYEAHYHYLLYFLIGLTKNEALAEDMIQDLFAKLLMTPESIADVTYMRSWLITSAKNNLIDHYRKKQPDLMEDEVIETLLIDHFTPEATVIHQAEMASYLEDLSEQDKAIILAKEHYGYSYEEMSALFNIPVSTLKSKVFRTKKRIIKKRWRHE